MVTMQQIYDNLKDVRYYYSKQKMFESASKCIVESAVVEKVNRYNEAVKNAPPRLYELYYELYVQNNTQAALARKWDYGNDFIKKLNRKLVEYLFKTFNEMV